MNFTTELPLPFVLGGTVEENIARLDDHFFNEKGSGTDLEGFLVLDGTGDDEENMWKIVSIIEYDACVVLNDGDDLPHILLVIAGSVEDEETLQVSAGSFLVEEVVVEAGDVFLDGAAEDKGEGELSGEIHRDTCSFSKFSAGGELFFTFQQMEAISPS